MPLVASIDYVAKRIYLSAETVTLPFLDTIAIYKEVRGLRSTVEAHRAFKPMIIAGGNIIKIPNVSATPAYVQLLYGCRIVPYNTSHSIKLIRDTFTDDGLAGRDCFDRTSLSASVAVDIDVDISEIEIRMISTGGSVLTPVESAKLMSLPNTDSIASAVWQHTTSTELINKVALVETILRNKTVTNPTTGVMTVYDVDGVTPLLTAQLYEDVNKTQLYRGQGAEVKERLV